MLHPSAQIRAQKGTRMPATPKDRKAPSGTKFTAIADGKPKTFTLPEVDESIAGRIPGEIVFDAIMNPSDQRAEMRLTLANIDAANLPAATRAALLSLPFEEMVKVVGEWLGESAGSSSSSGDTGEPSSTTGDTASA